MTMSELNRDPITEPEGTAAPETEGAVLSPADAQPERVSSPEEEPRNASEDLPQEVTPPAEPAPGPSASAATRHALSVPGTITKSVYESIKKYLIPPFVKVLWICVLAAEVLTSLYGIIFEGSYGSLVLMLLLGGLLVFFYFHMQTSSIKNVLRNHPELKNHGYKVVITFGSGIRLMNLTTGVERNLAYKEIYSIAETDKTILCFAKKDGKHRHLLIPKDEMTEEQRDAVMEILHSRCGKLKKRW